MTRLCYYGRVRLAFIIRRIDGARLRIVQGTGAIVFRHKRAKGVTELITQLGGRDGDPILSIHRSIQRFADTWRGENE